MFDRQICLTSRMQYYLKICILINIIPHFKKKKYTYLDGDKAFDKIQHIFISKTPSKVGINGQD